MPPTPSTGNVRLNTNANTFVPSRSAKVTLKTPDGREINLDALKPHPSAAPKVAVTTRPRNRSSFVRMESEEDKKKRLAKEKIRDEKDKEGKGREAKESEEERVALKKYKESFKKVKTEAEEKKRKEREEV